MVALNDKKYQRALFFAGIMAVLIVAVVAQWVRKDVLLKDAESQVRGEFSQIERVSESLASPLRIQQLYGEFDLSKHKDRFIVLNLWATWCAPCVAELPTLQRLKNHYKNSNIDVLAVSIDYQKELNDIAAFLVKHKIGDVALNHDAQGDIQKSLKIDGLPVTYIIVPGGRVFYRITGPAHWDSRKIIRFIDEVRQIP